MHVINNGPIDIRVVFLYLFLRFNIVFHITSNMFLYVSCVTMTMYVCMYVCMYACMYEIGKQLVAILLFAILWK